MLKPIFFQILRVIVYPFMWCRQVILDAPLMSCDDAPLGFEGYSHFTSQDRDYTEKCCPSCHAH